MRVTPHVFGLAVCAIAVGCSTTPSTDSKPDSNPTKRLSERQHDDVERQETRTSLRFDQNTEATHRARYFYLQGVRLIDAKPPRIDEAIREFQIALEHDPLYYKAHFKLGYCYFQKGLYHREIAEYKKCLALNPDYVEALLNLGHAHLARDELDEAREAYLKVLERDSNNATVRYNLGLVEFDLGKDFASSAKHLQRFLELTVKPSPQTKHAQTVLDRIQERDEKKR